MNYSEAWLEAVRDERNQTAFVDFLLQSDSSVCKILAKIATTEAKTEDGLVIHYGHHAVDFYAQQPNAKDHPYLFHGTDATWDIIDSWRLKESPAVYGTGIYFGRDYQTSEPYASRQHKTKRKDAMRSILVFHNNQPGLNLIARNPSELSNEYFLKGVPEYRLDSLVAIVFWSKEDVMEFGYRFMIDWSDERQAEFLSKGIKLYDQSLRPLDYDTVWEAFCRVFKAIPDVFSVDPELAFWPVGRQGFKLYSPDILLKHTKDNPQFIRKIANMAMLNHQYYFLHGLRKHVDDRVWKDVLEIGLYKDILLDVDIPSQTRERLLFM